MQLHILNKGVICNKIKGENFETTKNHPAKTNDLRNISIS